MASRKASKTGNWTIPGIIVVVGAMAAVPKELWIVLALALVIGIALLLYAKTQKSSSDDSNETFHARIEPSIPTGSHLQFQSSVTSNLSGIDSPSSVRAEANAVAEFKIPARPKELRVGTWIGPDQVTKIAGLDIRGGMVYVGTNLSSVSGFTEPCLIDPTKKVAAQGDFTQRQTSYWPSYSEISPSARRAYLTWLADGRCDARADIGYVFLFFYGLERRVLLDASNDKNAKADLPAIAQELRRLLEIYGDGSNSFRGYASGLVDWISLQNLPAKLYDQPIPSLPKSFEVPPYVRLALGQASADGVPIPVDLALAWAKLDPNIFFRTPATRCADHFDILFRQHYLASFGDGMVLPRNKTRLKVVYRPASAGFRGQGEIKLTFGDTPDVSVLMGPIKKLQEVVELATKQLEPYSRYVGKNPDAVASLEALLQLPPALWPASAIQVTDTLKNRMGGGMVVVSFSELLASLEAKSPLTKDKILGFGRALESMNIGMEPDILAGAKPPRADDKIVLFTMTPSEPVSRSLPAYQAAVLTLQLSAAVALADGDFSASEMNHLRIQVQSWNHLTPSQQRRLLAHLRLLMLTPVPLASLKKKLEPLSSDAKESIATFMATVAQSDGTVSPAEIKVLEKVYKALGVDPRTVFSTVHAVSSGSVPTAKPARASETGFRLDAARIAQLRQDTDRVSALLADIFKEEETIVATIETVPETAEPLAPTGLLGLDESHSTLSRMLLSRPQWSRSELVDLAADLDLMLDGAMEQINEASYDKLNIPFTEGDDPVEVNAEVLEKLAA